MPYGSYLDQKVQRLKLPSRGWQAGLLAAILFSGLLSPTLTLRAGTPDFQVVMVSPQRFRIQPLVSGPVSSSIVGGAGNQTLIIRQENGHTVIDAEVPVGATLHLQVGSKGIKLQMVDSQHFTWGELGNHGL